MRRDGGSARLPRTSLEGIPELEVSWTADAPSLQGKAMRVPMPPRALPREQAMEARGFADSFSLRLRHHNERLHARNAPAEPAARACYDAVELVRYEALGSNNYAGMRDNLDAALNIRIGAGTIRDVPPLLFEVVFVIYVERIAVSRSGARFKEADP